MTEELKPCPFCKDTWIFASEGDFNSGYEKEGYRVNCLCGYAWKKIGYYPTKEEAIEAWNRRAGEDQK